MTYKEIVAWGIAHGLIHLELPSTAYKYDPNTSIKERRAKRMQEGLTALGEKRKYKSYPKLKGLDKNTYHREYMKIKRDGLI